MSELETLCNTFYASFILFMRLIIYAHDVILTEINSTHFKSEYSYQPWNQNNLKLVFHLLCSYESGPPPDQMDSQKTRASLGQSQRCILYWAGLIYGL